MKKPGVIILLATIFVMVYQAAPFIGIPPDVIFTMFALSPFLLIYMVYVVLKYGKPSGYTFEERFYDDVEPD